mmetsp:Transcript_43818/g.101229  ORF Transcript_43818/g.101229 Transcript_43818/m.101229 type:complete len:172 (-) Transcript_43818:22-537(-)
MYDEIAAVLLGRASQPTRREDASSGRRVAEQTLGAQTTRAIAIVAAPLVAAGCPHRQSQDSDHHSGFYVQLARHDRGIRALSFSISERVLERSNAFAEGASHCCCGGASQQCARAGHRSERQWCTNVCPQLSHIALLKTDSVQHAREMYRGSWGRLDNEWEASGMHIRSLH